MLGIKSDNLVFDVHSYERTGLLDLICSVYRAGIGKQGYIPLKRAKNCEHFKHKAQG